MENKEIALKITLAVLEVNYGMVLSAKQSAAKEVSDFYNTVLENLKTPCKD